VARNTTNALTTYTTVHTDSHDSNLTSIILHQEFKGQLPGSTGDKEVKMKEKNLHPAS